MKLPLEKMFGLLPIGVMVITSELEVVYWNSWIESRSGISSSEATGKHITKLFPDIRLNVLKRRVRQVITLKRSSYYNARMQGYLIPIKNESNFDRFKYMQQNCELSPLFSENSEDVNICITIIDVTEGMQAEASLKELHADLEERSWTDALTGVKNRGYLMEHLSKEMKAAERRKAPLSVVMTDIDRFKSINDTYGHTAGDMVLCETAAALQRNLREVDIIGRYGGEEFLLVLPDTSNGERVAERLRAILAGRVFYYGGREIKVTASFGVARLREGDTQLTLLNRADARLYEAKRGGRNQVVSEGEGCPPVSVAGSP